MFKYFKKQQLMVQNNIKNYFFSKGNENGLKNEVNSDLVRSSSNEVKHDKNIDKSIDSETSMLLCYKIFYLVLI